MTVRRKDPRLDAAKLLVQIIDKHQRSTDVLNEALNRYPDGSPDAALLHELTMGVLRRRTALIHVISPLLKSPFSKTAPIIQEILLIMAYSFLYLTKIPPHAIVHSAVQGARKMGGEPAARFVNAIGRALERQSATKNLLESATPAMQASIPKWMQTLARATDPRPWDDANYEALGRPFPLVLRPHKKQTELLEALIKQGLTATPTKYAIAGIKVDNPAALRLFVPQMAVPQDEASQLVVQALAPQNGERIADLCSGVGIKTSQILSLAPEAELLAVDIDKQKLDKAIELSKTAGLGGFDTLAMDATRLPEHLDGSFDAVLLDAPCTGLGTLGRRPEVRHLRKEQDVKQAAKLQVKLLQRALLLLKPGGRLIYAVCSFALEESDGVVDTVLTSNNCFTRQPIESPLVDKNGAIRTFPWRDYQMDGFVIIKITRSC